jgi:hypothetical protein
VRFIAALLVLTSSAFSQPARWIPARRHSHAAGALDLLTGSPVNCILIEPADWDPGFLRAASKAGIAALGVIRPGLARWRRGRFR